jgi:protein-disulfide isomerase
MILLQKNVIRAWCPLCLGIAAVVSILAASQMARHFIYRKENNRMNRTPIVKSILLLTAVLIGFGVSFTGIAKSSDASTGQINIALGKQDSKVEVYLFSDWLCPVCVKVEGVIESVYPALSQKARIVFVDKIIHPEAANFVPYHLSFAAYEKPKYLQLRKALFTLAQKTKNPSNEDVRNALIPLKVEYRQLSFLEVTQQMAAFQKLGDQFKVAVTPTLVIHNARSNRTRVLAGGGEITPTAVMAAMKEVE